MTFTTADLCDAHSDEEYFQIAEPLFRPYGARPAFCGQITTVKVFEDNVLVKAILEQKVENRVLVIDGGGSHRCALVGDNLARIAIDNGWQGMVIYGCIRDCAIIDKLPIGIRALHTHPLKSHKSGHGDRDLLITFAGVNFRKNHYLYADTDGIIVSETLLS
ncbi:putative 4-hydroxy-4-methyl-2-oxoglutarate aldolase [Candidatus Methylobacter favarea]|uniref:4-hydroxy-4-methyl-2-oxoglutarate aldolase n=1 Tax=Candidatus Methylobacter favarea TaxID=2707345 RepID=A0A8S0XRD4_9GAMM|nr:ribonuclease E activity regulator RraA [Candidatus Methylobacter favarea]CAA9889919.1 putative 4-hydroxy-4-methyl-2-oxoglutarate aldolase [Candidatus Methylobacter favarea]